MASDAWQLVGRFEDEVEARGVLHAQITAHVEAGAPVQSRWRLTRQNGAETLDLEDKILTSNGIVDVAGF